MPIYEYRCQGCGKEFEAFILRKSETPQCPGCKSEALDQLLTAFGVNSAERSAANVQVAQKKFERTELRDKNIADAEYMNHHDD